MAARPTTHTNPRRTRFRPEFRPAFDAWLAIDPLTNPDAPRRRSRWATTSSRRRADAERLDAEAEVNAAIVRRNIQRSANYVLAVVLFAVALFFAGMSTKLPSPGPRTVLVVVGCLVFAGILTDAFENTPRIMQMC